MICAFLILMGYNWLLLHTDFLLAFGNIELFLSVPFCEHKFCIFQLPCFIFSCILKKHNLAEPPSNLIIIGQHLKIISKQNIEADAISVGI